MPILIGLLGKKRSGKSTCAKYIQEKFAFENVSFAEGVKRVSTRRYSLRESQMEIYKDTIDHRWNKTPRDIFKEIGMNARKGDPDYWVKYLHTRILHKIKSSPHTNFVISDVRFKNEADFIVKHGGYLIRVIRPGLKEDNHISETEGDCIEVDMEIHNDSTVKNLVQVLDNIIIDIIKKD